MHHVFIINPVAGKQRETNISEAIKERFSRFSQSYEILTTEGPYHARDLAMQAVSQAAEKGESLRIYSVGGDGTLNEIINGVIGADVEIGVIPCGTGNDSIRSLYAITDPFKLIMVLPISASTTLDLGKANDRYFFNISSIGFDADVVLQSRRYKSAFPGPIAYLMGVISALIWLRKFRLNITIDQNESIEKDFLLSIFANGAYYGGGFNAAPSAKMDDGLLDFCLVESLSRFKIVRFLNKFRKGSHENMEEASFSKGKRAVVTSDKPFPVNIDGELSLEKALTIEHFSEKIKIIIP